MDAKAPDSPLAAPATTSEAAFTPVHTTKAAQKTNDSW